MPSQNKSSDKVLKLPSFVELPVLTESQVTDTTMLPVLTEALLPELAPAQPAGMALTETQCRQLAEQLAPQLETLLREKLSARLGPLWAEIWREAQAELPGLIRKELRGAAPRTKK